jgi:hypothetical protein
MTAPTPDRATAQLQLADEAIAGLDAGPWWAYDDPQLVSALADGYRALRARLAAQQPVIDAAAELRTYWRDWPEERRQGVKALSQYVHAAAERVAAEYDAYRAASGSVEADTPAEPGEAPGRALLREVLDTLGMAGTRDWDDVLNVLRCWRKQREVADTPAAEPAPDGWCCGAMLRATSLDCDRHSSAHECPDVLVLRDVREGGDYGLPVRDGGSSFVVIGYCPWCGADLLAGAGAPTEPADDTQETTP